MPPQAKNLERIREQIDKKYPLQINNPKGHNRFTAKKDLERKEEEPSDLEKFKKLGMLDQKK